MQKARVRKKIVSQENARHESRKKPASQENDHESGKQTDKESGKTYGS